MQKIEVILTDERLFGIKSHKKIQICHKMHIFSLIFPTEYDMLQCEYNQQKCHTIFNESELTEK